MAQTFALVEHAGRWLTAEVLAQYRIDRRWRVRVRYSTAPGYCFEHARWADELRPITSTGPTASTVTVNPRPVANREPVQGLTGRHRLAPSVSG